MWQLDGVNVEEVRREIQSNKELHRHYVDKLNMLYKRRRYEEAAWLAMFLGYVSFQVHCGQYASVEIEHVLNAISGHLDETIYSFDLPSDRRGQSKRHVLHVVSKCYHLGGHTKAMSRMIANTSDECVSCVAITLDGQAIPEWLIASVCATGGKVHRLDLDTSLLSRARALRGLANKWADLVVLHIHPHDPLANLAFAHGLGIPVIFFNHADHVFWYGTTIADTVGDIRPAGRQLSLTRRGVLNSQDLPIPLQLPASAAIPDAKVRLGFAEDDIVILSVASQYKYKKIGSLGFLEIHERILRNHPKAKLLVVGPELAGEWQEYHDSTGGRITAVGIQKDLSLFYSGADLYVDSYPFSSLTSLLDFCLYGKPAIGLTNSLSPVMSCDEFSLNAAGVSQESLLEYEATLVRLIEHEELRKGYGAKIRQQIIDDHTGSGWRSYWNVATSMGKLERKHQTVNDEITDDDIFITMMSLTTGNWRNVRDTMPLYLRNFGVNLNADIAIDNMCNINFFRDSRIPIRYFISGRSVAVVKKCFLYELLSNILLKIPKSPVK